MASAVSRSESAAKFKSAANLVREMMLSKRVCVRQCLCADSICINYTWIIYYVIPSFAHYCVFHFHSLGPDAMGALLQRGKLVQVHLLLAEPATQIRVKGPQLHYCVFISSSLRLYHSDGLSLAIIAKTQLQKIIAITSFHRHVESCPSTSWWQAAYVIKASLSVKKIKALQCWESCNKVLASLLAVFNLSQT